MEVRRHSPAQRSAIWAKHCGVKKATDKIGGGSEFRWNVDLSEVVESPAHHRAIGQQRGRVISTRSDLCDGREARRWSALVRAVLAKACNCAVTSKRNGVQFARSDGDGCGESGWRRDLAVVVVPPANYGAIRPHGDRVVSTCGDGIRVREGARNSALTEAVAAPTRDGSVRSKRHGV